MVEGDKVYDVSSFNGQLAPFRELIEKNKLHSSQDAHEQSEEAKKLAALLVGHVDKSEKYEE